MMDLGAKVYVRWSIKKDFSLNNKRKIPAPRSEKILYRNTFHLLEGGESKVLEK